MADQTKVLVTGATGYIGAHVVKQLLADGYQVRGTVRDLTNETKIGFLKELPNASSNLELVQADLTDTEKWDEVVKDCAYVQHIASPFPSGEPKDPQEVIKPAVDGTLTVLKACAKARSVKRVVLTSSSIAVAGLPDDKEHDEADWTDAEDATMGAYTRSKVLAEKAAWDFVKDLTEDEKFELAVINPGFVVGPMLSKNPCTSLEVIKRILEHKDPATVKVNFGMVDVRDVAAAHVAAMTVPEAAGHRHLVVEGSYWMREIALVLQAEFKEQGYRIATMGSPYAFVWLLSYFDKTVKLIKPMYGKQFLFNNNRMKEVLKMTPKPMKEAVIDMAYSMIELGLVKKAKKYLGHPDSRQQSTASASGDELESSKPPTVENIAELANEATTDVEAKAVVDEDEDLKKPAKETAEGDGANVISVE